MKKPELLAPAGNMDSLEAAISAGCDAVYLAGKLYGARSYAKNFTNEELKQAVEYAHLYCVKVYITVNTVIYESEIPNFIKYVRYLSSINVDGLLLQDIGMIDLIRKKFPELELHASTQMHIHNLEGVLFAQSLGMKRVVLARETPIELIKKIKKNTNIEIEVFVHGALCISYSGQCLMSSLIGGRSGNRGTCAQSCRQPYQLYCNDKYLKDNDYLLSTKDLNALNNIDKLLEIGIDSLKIEGRMKRPEYVYYVVSLYRKAIDNYINKGCTNITSEEICNLKKLFNREFTNGFLFNEFNIVNSFRPNHIGIKVGHIIKVKNNRVTLKLVDDLYVQDGIRIIEQKDDVGLIVQNIFKNGIKCEYATAGDIIDIITNNKVHVGNDVLKTTDVLLMKDINKKIMIKRKIKINFSLEAKLNKQLVLKVSDNNHFITVNSDYIVCEAIKNNTSDAQIITQLSKIGDTVYEIENIDLDIDQNIFVPVKVINELRRDALIRLTEKRLERKKYVEKEYNIDLPDYEVKIKHNIYTNKIIDNYNGDIIMPYEFDSACVIKKLPKVNENIPKIQGKLLVGEYGSLYQYLRQELYTDYSFNVTNSYAVAFFHFIGVKRITLSVEMNEYQIKQLMKNYLQRYGKLPNVEVIVSQRPEAMVLKYDIFKGKYNENNKYYLKDRFNNKYPIIRKYNLTYIYFYEVVNKKYNIENISTRENSIEI